MKAEIFIIILNSLFIFINLKEVFYLERNQSNIIKHFLNSKKANILSDEYLIYKKLLFGLNNNISLALENNSDNDTNNDNDNNNNNKNKKKKDDDDDHKKLLIIVLSAFGVVVVIAIIIIIFFRRSKSSYNQLKERVYKISFSEEEDDRTRKESEVSE